MYDENVRYTFKGIYSGCTENLVCSFTLPGIYGSSGSAVINKKGEIVSILSASVIAFPVITIGPTAGEIRQIVERNVK
jgi:hypothetical protein